MYLTEPQTLNLEVKFIELSERYPSYRENGFLEAIKGIVLTLDYDVASNSEQGILSHAARGFLSSNFQVNLNQHPSMVGWVIDTLYAAILSEAQLKDFRARLPNPVTFEKLLLERVFFDKEIFSDIDKLDGLLSAFIDMPMVQRQFPEARIDNDARTLNQIIFFLGTPFDVYTNSSARESEDENVRNTAQIVQLCYDKMISADFNIGDIVEDILFWPENLPNSLNSFFANLASDAGFGLEPQDQREISDLMDGLRDALIAFYLDNPSPFILLKPRFASAISSENDIRLIRAAAAVMEPPAPRSQGFSREDVKTAAVMERLSSHLSQEWLDLAADLLNIYSKQLAMPETREIFDKLPIIGFVEELFLRHYQIGNGENLYRTGNIQLDKILVIVGEVHMIHGGRDLVGIQRYADRLRPEIRDLKTKRQLNDKVVAYFGSDLHGRIIKTIEHHLKPFARVIAEHVPREDRARAGLLSELDTLISKTSEIAHNFKRRYEEVSDEIAARQEKEGSAELSMQAELSAQIDREVAEQQAFYAEMAAMKSVPKHQGEMISCGEHSLTNGGLVELQWSLKGDKTRADSAYNKSSYRVIITKELYELIRDANNNLSQEIKAAVESGFVPTGGRGRSGVKPMDHSDTVDGYVVIEVKFTGNKLITSFLGNSSVTIGDIRLCGVLKDGVVLISEISQHGKDNSELSEVVKRIRKAIEKKSIEIKPAEVAAERSAAEAASSSAVGVRR